MIVAGYRICTCIKTYFVREQPLITVFRSLKLLFERRLPVGQSFAAYSRPKRVFTTSTFNIYVHLKVKSKWLRDSASSIRLKRFHFDILCPYNKFLTFGFSVENRSQSKSCTMSDKAKNARKNLKRKSSKDVLCGDSSKIGDNTSTPKKPKPKSESDSSSPQKAVRGSEAEKIRIIKGGTKKQSEIQPVAQLTSPTEKATPEEHVFIEKIKHCRTDCCESVDLFKFNKQRVRVLSEAQEFSDDCKGVLYWMSRDQRVQDNWALLYAQRMALKFKVPLHVCFCLVPKFLDATIRQFGFMMKGLEEVAEECYELNIAFHLLTGEAASVLPDFVKEHKIGCVVTDFSPLRTPMKWVSQLKEELPEAVPLCQVDAHNIVPCWVASPKQEYGARTIRSKIHKVLADFLTEFPPVVEHPHCVKVMPKPVDWAAAEKFLQVDRSVKEVEWARPGTTSAMSVLESFCTERLKYFSCDRNNPNKQAVSNLSPWIHFGQISVQRCILIVKQYKSKSNAGVDAFIEEAVVRRELADNFCFYNNELYDSIEGAYKWARDTLDAHSKDKRPYIYSREQLEQAKTHDDLWNAAQIQMVKEGKMHGFLRMYWAKKILEWTSSPQVALKEAIYLNDKYNLDGRDPNGYVGCMWSICGIHDQGWAERAVFGKIRYMNYEGCKRKFDVAAFVRKYAKK